MPGSESTLFWRRGGGDRTTVLILSADMRYFKIVSMDVKRTHRGI